MFKILFIFFALAFCFSLNPQENFSAVESPENYIQNGCQKVVLVSNNFSTSPTIASREADSPDFASGGDHIINNAFQDNILLKNNIRFYRESIHNLSTGNENYISIRAP